MLALRRWELSAVGARDGLALGASVGRAVVQTPTGFGAITWNEPVVCSIQPPGIKEKENVTKCIKK